LVMGQTDPLLDFARVIMRNIFVDCFRDTFCDKTNPSLKQVSCIDFAFA
jgi:hypothetical protein